MSTLSNDQLTQARAILETTLPDTCNILTATLTSDGQGGNAEAWGTATAGVSCRLDAMTSGNEVDINSTIKEFRSYMLTVPWGTTITSLNRIEHGSETYNVRSVDVDKSWAICRRAILTRA